MKWNECLQLFWLLYLVERRCSAIVTWWWKPCFSQLNLGTCILLNCGCSWIQCPVATMLQDLWELKMLTSPYFEHLKFFLLDNQQQTTTYIEALQNFRYTNALMHYYSNNLQVLNIARIYLVGLRGSVWLWELLMLLIISRASEAKKVQLQAAQRKCFPE